MSNNNHAEKSLRWAALTIAVAGATLLLEFLHANSTMAGMAFLVLVVWTATQAGIALSLYMATVCALAFDFFFLPPYHTLRLQGWEQWIAMACFAASCVAVSRVAERARSQREEARQRQADVERLYELSQEMMLHSDAEGLIRDLPMLVARIFGLEAVALFVCDRDHTYASPNEVPKSVEAGLRSLAQGQVSSADLTQDFQATPLTLEFQAAPLTLGLRSAGALAWRPAAMSREVAAAVSAQVAIVLARAITMEASARMEAAREADRLRNALIDSLTHELRTPLTSIRAASSTLLQGGELDEELRVDLAKIIDEESARLDALIGESVEMAEIDANILEVQLAPHHLRTFLEEAVEQSRKALTKHKVTIVTEEPESPASFDAHLLGRVLRHLLENAASYTQAGSRIRLMSRRAGNRLEFSVEDEGPGIEARDLPLIFDKFYRGKRGAEMRKGSGMGLAIVRAILVAHGGSIEVTSEPGAGACFRFWVPVIEIEPEGKSAVASETAEARQAPEA
jgi:two-component system, OmpR family, sensor histidine kinase KdpD